MSLITRCPACTTMFRIVPDQLRVSDGWVRCGQCDEVFDANAHLHEESASEVFTACAPEVVDTESKSSEDPPLQWTRNQEDGPILASSPDHWEVTFHGAPGAATDLTPAQADPFLEMSPQELSSYSGDREAGALEHDPLHVAPGKVESSREPNTGQALAPQYVQLDAALRGDAPASKLSFLPVVRAPSARLLPMGRLALLAACLLLIVVLSLQVIVQQRDVIATVEPGAKPWLETLCTALGCEISPVLQIESVVIESSSFSRVRGDVYRLNFTLKNTAQLTIATPALELTLTDSQDQSMVRRVFNASDLGAKLDAMALGSELTGSLSISVTELNHPERISGYRLLAFYP